VALLGDGTQDLQVGTLQTLIVVKKVPGLYAQLTLQVSMSQHWHAKPVCFFQIKYTHQLFRWKLLI